MTIPHVDLAVDAWTKQENGKREFAEHAAKSGVPAAQIAARIRQAGGDCSDSQAVKYINAYKLYYQMSTELEDQFILQAWHMLSPTHWVRLAEKQSNYEIPLETCWNHVCDALEDSVSSRAFAAHLDSVYNHTPEWKRKLNRAVVILQEFDSSDFVNEIPPNTRNRLRVIFQRTARLIARALEKEG